MNLPPPPNPEKTKTNSTGSVIHTASAPGKLYPDNFE
jgi:hypothetical protein